MEDEKNKHLYVLYINRDQPWIKPYVFIMLVLLVVLLSATCLIRTDATSYIEPATGKPPKCDVVCPGPNEVYKCGGECDNVCSRLKIETQDNCLTVNIQCTYKCYCKKGYARNAKNICIPIKDCPPICPLNEEYTEDKKICPSDLCSSITSRCVPKSSGKPGCVCKSGYLRKKKGSPCTPICQCPELANSKECCYPH